MTTLAPPFTYYGGKIRTAQWILNHFPAQAAERTTDLAQMAKVRGELFRRPQPQVTGQEHLFTPEVAG